MSIYEQIMQAYPELTEKQFTNGTIQLQNDSDGSGDYIKEWNYSKPLPSNLTLGKTV